MTASWADEFDFVCVGSGIGGLSGAIAASVAGLRVLVVEKTALAGGVTAYSGGQLWAPGNKYAAAVGINDSLDEGISYIEHLAEGWANPKMTRALFERGQEAFDFYENCGVSFRMIPGLPDYYYPDAVGSKSNGRYIETPPFNLSTLGSWKNKLRVNRTASQTKVARHSGIHGMLSESAAEDMVENGESLAASFVAAAIRAGVDIWLESPMVGLVRDGDRVVGVTVRTRDREFRVRARRGVLLATGGYDRNKKLLHRFEGQFEPYGSIAPPGLDGDHLIMASEIGAAIMTLPPERTATTTGFLTDDIDEVGDPVTAMYWAMGPHEILVNRSGKRFADESFYPELHSAVHAFDPRAHGQPNWPIWLIFDENYWSSPVRSQQPGPHRRHCVVADTLDELAQRAGIDPSGLSATVARFNAMCAKGRDEDFGRGEMAWVVACMAFQPTGADVIGPIETGPFYAAKVLQAFFSVPSAGLEINEFGQVMKLTGEPIDGLYATGNAAGRNDMGMSLQSGVANFRGMMYGFLAAQHTLSTTAAPAAPA